jgi:hypothetical protein
MIFGEKNELNVYINQQNFVSDIQNPTQFNTWAYGKEKIRGAERNLPDFFGLCPHCPKLLSGGGDQ